MLPHRLGEPLLDDPPEVHDGDRVADVVDDAEVVGDEQQPGVALAGEADEEVGDLRLGRGVERRDRLVGDDDLRVGRQRPGDGDALALAAGELERIAVGDRPVEPDLLEQRGDLALALAPVAGRPRSPSAICLPMRRRGLSEA